MQNENTKFIPRTQMQTILDNAPEGVDKNQLINKFVSNGYKVEGVNDKPEPNMAQTIAGSLIKAPTDLIGAGFAGAGALGAYAGKKLTGQDTTLSQEYANQSQQVQQSGANSIVQPITGEQIRPAENLEQLGGDILQTGAIAAPGVGLAKGAATGAALLGGAAMSDNQSAFDVVKQTLLGGALGGALGAAVPAIEKLSGAINKATPGLIAQGEKGIASLTPNSADIMQRVLRVTKGQQSKFEKTYGTSIGQYAVDRGLIGTQEKVATDLATRFTTSMKAADDALASLPGKYKPEAIKTALDDLLEKKIATSAKGATDPELNLVKQLINKYENVGLDMSEINQAKRLYERNVKLDFVKTNNPEGVKLANNIDDAIRSWQFNQAERLGLKNLPDINKETRMAKEVLNSLEREMSGQAGNNAISLTDWIVLADGGAMNMAAFLAKRGFSSDMAQAFVAKYFAPKVAKIGMPTAQNTAPQIDATVTSYLDFLKKTGAIAKDIRKPQSLQKLQKVSPLKESIPQTTKGAIPPMQKDLSLVGEDALIQDKSIQKYLANRETLLTDYLKDNGKVVNTDEARKLFKDVGYKGSNAAAVQEASSAVAKDVWRNLLTKSKGKDVLIYAGGSGTGKTSAVKNILPNEIKDASAILDGNLSSMKSAEARIQEALDAGANPHIVYVYRTPEESWVEGVIKRMNDNKEEGGRLVPLSVFLENHKGSYDVVKNLLKDSNSGKLFQIDMVDNSLGKGSQTLLSQKKFDSIKYDSATKDKLLQVTKSLYEQGKIKTKEQYEALIK